ncbi:MAG: S8 family serine peptidase [Verrucomicrobiales bacterium]|nr:S8 family serine peptidase [Verrucomicrobiales bacterium]
MMRLRQWAAGILLALAIPGSGIGWGHAADLPGTLRWHRVERRVDADINGWPLAYALERIAAVSGYEVFVEPELESRVAARFQNRPEREALASLLSDVNFAVVPGASRPSRLLVFRSSTSEATQAVKARQAEADEATGTNVLGRELIVRLKPGSKMSIQELAKKLGARVAGSIDSLGAHRLIFDDEASATAARTSLASEEEVAAVESNYSLRNPSRIDPLPGGSAAPLGIRARPVSDGSSVIVALLDTGLPSSGLPHSDFLLPSVNIGGAGTEAGLTHGSAMFETILQGLSLSQRGDSGQPVRVLPVDIYGGRSETSTFELAQGIAAALERGADVLNLSLSGPSPSPVVHDVLKQANAAGVVAFGAPGNEPTTSATYPAAYPEVVAVTASERSGQLASYANRGSFVDLIAPGTSVVPYAGETWVVNGTSVSTAYAAGVAAGLLADSGRTSAEVLVQMRERLAFKPEPPKP